MFFEPVSSIAPILNAPYTALAQLSKLRNGKTEDDLKEAMALVGTAKDVKGSHGAAFGRTVEKDDVYAFLTSWDSPAVSLLPIMGFYSLILHPHDLGPSRGADKSRHCELPDKGQGDDYRLQLGARPVEVLQEALSVNLR